MRRQMNKMIARINKNAGETVVISLSEFQGKELIDIRIWLRPADPREEGEGENRLTPTKKGVCMNVYSIPRLIEGLKKAEEELARDSKEAEHGTG